MNTLKPCPFCGVAETTLPVVAHGTITCVWCKACGARGPQAASEIDAIEKWNEASLRVDLDLEHKEADDYKKLVEALHADLDAMRGRLDATRPGRFP